MSNAQPIIIKKIKKSDGGGHHGGAWKVAYADFVTAMMAFFLLMWLINTTSPEQKRGIADYFAPASVSKSAQGSDGLLGGTAFENEGARSSGAMSTMPELKSQTRRKKNKTLDNTGSDNETTNNNSRNQFAAAEQSLRQAILDLPDLAELSRHLIVDQTPEGLRIQLIDQEGRAMFARNSAEPLPRAGKLLTAVAKIIDALPNRISIDGHSGTSPDGWRLSSDRANAARELLEQAGVDQERIYQISGKAGSEPLYPDDPSLPGNRRVSIVLLREAPVLPEGHSLSDR